VDSADVALELPTGSGKTLPALLIAEWRRSSFGQRLVYACPTIQLANQVHGEARRQGIDAITLYGRHREWETADVAKYDSARAIAITTYSTVFNSNPALSTPETSLFDDSHAAEQYVARAWSVSVSRFRDEDLYIQLLNAIGPELSGIYIQQLGQRDPDPRTRTSVRLLPLAAVRRRAQQIDLVLGAVTGDMRYRYTMLRPALDRCLVYYGWDGFLIRPFIPPTGQHAQFIDANQRVYISATLGDGGELERAFGRAPIQRLPVPEGWEERSSGRRFFVFPELIRDVDARSLTRTIITEAKKALIITPSDRRLQEARQTLVPTGVSVFGSEDIETSLTEFRQAPEGVLALANRYDGIDLADESCRLTVLDGFPDRDHLQERFLVDSLRAGRVIEERLRTRVVQGAGRCTRGLRDHSAVVILGDALTRFLQRREVRAAMRPEIQAELDFGIRNSEGSEAEVRRAVRSFLSQDDDWQSDAEPELAELRREFNRLLPRGTEKLAMSAAAEVKAWQQVWRGEYEAASQSAVEVAQTLNEADLTPYRALWLYFASAWQSAAAEELQDEALQRGARELLRRAHAAATGMSWIRELAPLPVSEIVRDDTDQFAVTAVSESVTRRLSTARFIALVAEMLDGLTGTDHGPYEVALSILGGLLGAEAFKPPGPGRADSVWLFGNCWWVTFEAKSEARETGLLSIDNVRQTNSQLRLLESDRGGTAPDGSASVVITPRQLVHRDAIAIAEPHVYICEPIDMLVLAQDAAEAWREIRAAAMNLEGAAAEAIIGPRLADRRLQPSSIKERLLARAVAE
jgi:hypothetical protein